MPSVATKSLPPRERILEVASQLFYRDGIRAVGVDTLIAEAGVAKMTFYKHFPSKDDLVVAWLQRRDERWRDWFEGEVERRAKMPAGRLLVVFDALEAWFRQHDFRGCAFMNTMLEMADPDHPAHRAAAEHKRLVERYLADLARAASMPDPRRLARQLLILMDGATVNALRGEGERAARDARRMAEKLLGGA